jgi:chloramphenicol-sensitive protein RarD
VTRVSRMRIYGESISEISHLATALVAPSHCPHSEMIQMRGLMKSKVSSYALVISAYASWGLLPIFWALLSDVDPMTVLFQRTMWSALFLGCVLLARGKLLSACISALRPRQLLATCISTLCLGTNWYTYVWVLKHQEYFAASLAYYICPLLTLAGAAFVFHERLARRQVFAVALLASGVALPALVDGELPLLALVLAGSWSAYTLTRRYFERPSLQALFLETAMLTIVLSVLLPLTNGMAALVPTATTRIDLLLFVTSGVVTAIPILLLMEGMKVVPLKVVGILQYIAPTLTLLCSALYFEVEPSTTQLTSLAIIWSGLLAFFSGELHVLLARMRSRISDLLLAASCKLLKAVQ